MSEPVENHAKPMTADTRLAEAMREVKNSVADRDDVVVDIREAQRTRLELLAEDLQPVFSDIPDEDERFDLAISAGAQPRLWIDAVAHVTMGRDRRTYRFLRDTRLGRVVLGESADMKQTADHVTRYIAERLIERRRVLEGDVSPVIVQRAPTGKAEQGGRGVFLRALGIVLLGGVVGAGLILMFAWGQLAGF